MTGLDLSVDEELSSAFEPCLNELLEEREMMEPKDTTSVYLTRDNFLDILLDKKERWSPNAIRGILQTREAIDILFLAVTLYGAEQGYMEALDTSEKLLQAIGQAPLMVGKSFHLNLSKFVSGEIKDFTTNAAALISIVLFAHHINDPVALATTLATLVPVILNVVKTLDKKLGDVCVMESIQEHYKHTRKELKGFTAKEIAHELGGKPCRYPGQGCRYEKNHTCTLKKKNVEAILQGLNEKGIVEPFTYEEPHEWRVRF